MKEDKTDPVCGMQGTIPRYGHYFCSEHCIGKYEKDRGIVSDKKKTDYCPSCETKKGTPWYKEKLFMFGAITTLLFIFSFFFYKPLFEALLDYLKMIWWAVLIGFLLGGIIDRFVPKSYVMKYLSAHKKRTIFYAVGFGFLMSACSHGILAIAIELYKKGANTSSTIAFLLASPWANLSITVLLFSFFGAKAFLIVLSAIIIAIITGLIYQILERKNFVECNKCKAGEDIEENGLEDFSIREDVAKRFKGYKFTFGNLLEDAKGVLLGSYALAKMVLWWLLIGMILASFTRAFVPSEMFHQYLGPTVLGLLITLIFATVIEVCSEGSSPLAFEIFKQTGAFGNSFTFLMAGVATDYTEVGLVWSNIGKRAAILLPLITVPQILVLGYLFNIFL